MSGDYRAARREYDAELDRIDARSALIASAEHWERIANDRVAQAEWDRQHLGGDPIPSAIAYARTCRQTARALRLEAQTGKPHCSECLGDHPNHEHAHRG